MTMDVDDAYVSSDGDNLLLRSPVCHRVDFLVWIYRLSRPRRGFAMDRCRFSPCIMDGCVFALSEFTKRSANSFRDCVCNI